MDIVYFKPDHRNELIYIFNFYILTNRIEVKNNKILFNSRNCVTIVLSTSNSVIAINNYT